MNAPLTHFNTIRDAELKAVLSAHSDLFEGKEVLEIGSGTGIQLRGISQIAKSAVGLELIGGVYVRDESLNVREYDGLHIPFPDASFDLVFSSNVMEHIKEQKQINGEIRRVLRPNGKVIHVLPTRVWRVLTSLLHYPMLAKKIISRSAGSSGEPQAINGDGQVSRLERLRNIAIPAKHGEFGNWFTEYRYFGVREWAKHFVRLGWKVEAVEPVGLAYSGSCILAERLTIKTRSELSRFIGSSTAAFVLS